MIPARKRWGQHFLANGRTAERIVEAARLRERDTVIEVGPGDGALTRPLASRARRLLAVEIDPLRAAHLAGEFAGDSNVRILTGDVLQRSFADWLAQAGWSGPALLVANLPYNIATPILTEAIREPAVISRIVVTVQREVARRLAAPPGDESYGYLSVFCAAFARARILFDLPPGSFRPRPRVTSTVLELTPRDTESDGENRDRALQLASVAFRSRRKTAANALRPLAAREVWERALASIARDPRSRAEQLSFEDYRKLAARVP